MDAWLPRTVSCFTFWAGEQTAYRLAVPTGIVLMTSIQGDDWIQESAVLQKQQPGRNATRVSPRSLASLAKRLLESNAGFGGSVDRSIEEIFKIRIEDLELRVGNRILVNVEFDQVNVTGLK